MLRIGIDVGGTNTDAVLMDGAGVLAEVKTPTTADVTGGIQAAIATVMSASGADPAGVRAVMIGTTQFTNAVVEATRLMPVAAIRLALPATEGLPPMVDWPDRLHEALGGHVYLCRGGHEYDGSPIAPLDDDELRRVARDIAAKGIESVAITSVFSPVNGELEKRAAELVARELPGAYVSVSHEVGRVGLLERENATIVNASLRALAKDVAAAFGSALAASAIEAPVYLSQNDGTLMSVSYAERYPVATFASGPTNSMRGAAFLSGEKDCAVIDIGGTTSDIGMLVGGFPREAGTTIEVGGVRTNFRMPDVLSLGLGGGSRVRRNGGIDVGPDSVGYELTERALVFGGDTLTATDLAVAGERASIGDGGGLAALDAALVDDGLRRIEAMLADGVDRVRTSAEALAVVVVGGGSVLLGDELAGAAKLIRPEHSGVANAVGAAISQVSGEVDSVVSLAAIGRDDALEAAKREASERAVAAGASAATVDIVEVDEVPLAYLPGNAVRIRIKAVGDLSLEGSA